MEKYTPVGVRRAINKREIKINAGEFMTTIKPKLKGVQPRGYPSGYTWDGVDGCYDSMDRSVNVSEYIVSNRTHKIHSVKGYLSKDRLTQTFHHEVGHAFDDSISYAKSKKFREAYGLDYKDLKAAGKTEGHNSYFTQKTGGQAGRSEAFAQLYAEEITLKSTLGMPALERSFPRAARVMNELVNEARKASSAGVKTTEKVLKKSAVSPAPKPKIVKVPKTPESVKTVEDLKNYGKLPPDDDKYDYFYHAVSDSRDIESILKTGLDPGKSKYQQEVFWASKGPHRGRGAGGIIFRVPKGAAKEGIDRVEAGLQYIEYTFNKKVLPKDIIKPLRIVIDKTGFRIREDEIANFAARVGKSVDISDVKDLPEKYKRWFYLEE